MNNIDFLIYFTWFSAFISQWITKANIALNSIIAAKIYISSKDLTITVFNISAPILNSKAKVSASANWIFIG